MWPKCLDCYTHLCYFTTYHGEKYFGLLVRATDDRKRHFIIPTYHRNYPDPGYNMLQKWKDEEGENSNSSVLEKYGYEINDEKAIVHCQPKQPNYGYPRIEGNIGDRNGDIRTTKLFIFGAGASYGMSYDARFEKSTLRPPLVNELFDERFRDVYGKYPAATNSISVLRFQQNIEQYFQAEWDNISRKYEPGLLRDHINIQYYLQELFANISEQNRQHEANLYDVLFKRLRSHIEDNERIAVVSFNYDTFIEQALERTWGLTFNGIDDYISDERRVNLFKPHGSCNWGWSFIKEIPDENPSCWLYENNVTLDKIYFELLCSEGEMARSGYGQVLLNKSRIQVIRDGQPFYPALFIPYIDKDDFVLPFRHFNVLKDYISTATDIYLIGWKGSEVFFNRQLKWRARNLKKIVIVNPSEKKDREVSRNLAPYLRDDLEVVVRDDFREFVEGVEDVLEGK